MNLLIDTNIILNIIRSRDYRGIIEFINPENRSIYISVVSEAEIKSIAKRSNWGSARIEKLDNFLDTVAIVEINHQYINSYVEIDTYSQKSNPLFEEYGFSTPRNMGKNDLWIASLAGLLGLQLITTDADFDHLDGIFFEVRRITPTELSRFY
ncbi:type II toxin-antitoxin system VapC family toxin [Sphingobacterium sp. DN00404]|uniref:Type II toxin-antitoxin system VapC family toxin n=1 Tax=Sphingobacterium micropteri TaxID=2763501 RepID=A0ABR7YUI0_9SPHI|nr:type II toxin-antitoxin system VapC family toxin [Sphingobacterium micropteri]MBD1435003.1 type II toxin-antitoxin system VapC family toxin [Sphingobacterium micropteri]